MMKISKKDILLCFYILIIVICTGYLIFGGVVKSNSLDKNAEYTDAVIVDFSSGPRMRRYLDYKFYVNGKVYHGSGKYYLKSDTFWRYCCCGLR